MEGRSNSENSVYKTTFPIRDSVNIGIQQKTHLQEIFMPTSRKPAAKPGRKLGKTGGTTARPRCLMDQAHHHSSGASSSRPSEPVAAASIPPRTSGQSTL